MNAHNIKKGICIQCGCDTHAIEYFGWSCSGRVIEHCYENGTCVNCGFCKEVVEHFDWPCRLDYRTTQRDDPSERSSRDRNRSNRTFEEHYQSWRCPDNEIRYGRLLGLHGKVTKYDIKCAYREQANLYHPDRVAHLAPDIQELATEKMKEINMAFAYFQHKYSL